MARAPTRVSLEICESVNVKALIGDGIKTEKRRRFKVTIVCAKSPPEVVDSIDAGELRAHLIVMMGKFNDLLRIREEETKARLSLRQFLEEYRSARAEIFKEKLQAEGNGWCGVCSSIHNRDDLRWIYVEFWEHDDGSPPDEAEEEFVSAQIVLACQSCHKNGGRGGFMSPIFTRHFEVKLEDGKYFALLPQKHNRRTPHLQGQREWKEVDEKVEIALWPKSIPQDIAKVFKLPPDVTLTERRAGWSLALEPSPSGAYYSYRQSGGDGDDYLEISDK